MRSARVIALSLLIIAGGAMGARAQGAGPYYDNVKAMDYPLRAEFTGTNMYLLAYAAGMPDLTKTDLSTLSGAVATDGSGHVEGLVYSRVYFGGPNNHTNNYGAFSIKVTGKINGNKGNYVFVDFGNLINGSMGPAIALPPFELPNAPGTKHPIKPGKGLVKLTLKGQGYDFDGVSNYPNATLSLKFTSTNLLLNIPQLPPAAVTNSTYSITYADGSTANFTDGPKVIANGGFGFLPGQIKGNIKPGKKSPLNGGNQLKIDEAATLQTGDPVWFVVNNTNFVQRESAGGLIVDVLTNINAQVIQPVPGSKLWLNANVGSRGDLFQGIGTANRDSGTWNADFQGVAFMRGGRFHVKGTLGPMIVAYEPTQDTNSFPSGYAPIVLQDAIREIRITSGKVFGQPLPKLYGTNMPPTSP